MKKGRNTFKKYQAAKQDSRAQLIERHLKFLGTTRIKFPHVTGLAEMVAMHVSQQEEQPCNKSTLLRNKRYKSLLLSFMSRHLGNGIQAVKVSEIDDERAKILVLSTQLEATNLRREIERLKTYVSYLESHQSESTQPQPIPDNADLHKLIHEIRLKYVRTCQALQHVLQHHEKSLAIHTSKRQILDMSRLRNNVVVDTDLAEPFFLWLDENSGIGT